MRASTTRCFSALLGPCQSGFSQCQVRARAVAVLSIVSYAFCFLVFLCAFLINSLEVDEVFALHSINGSFTLHLIDVVFA